MGIFSLKDLEDTKSELKRNVSELHEQFKDRIVYSEKPTETEIRRPIILIKDKGEWALVKRRVKKIKELNDQILDATGKKLTMMPIPAVHEDVVMVRVWLNKAVSSRTNTTKREDIISRLKDFIHVANKYDSQVNRTKARSLQKELEFFENETEELYRVRSFGNTDVISRIYFENSDELRLRLTAGGLFIRARDFGDIRVVTPDDVPARKKRASMFDDLTPIKFSGTLSAHLYRESEVEKEKARINHQQSNTTDKLKNSKKKNVSDDVKAD